MKNIHYIGFILFLSMMLISCNSANDETEDTNENVENDQQEEAPEEEPEEDTESDEQDESEDEQSDLELVTGSTEMVNRTIEGMDEEVEVTNYEIEPYGIKYQLDEMFGEPDVDDQIMYAHQDGTYKITLEVKENTDLDTAVTDLQEEFEDKDYEEKGELESVPSDVNGLDGKMQFYSNPPQGFYAYAFDSHVLVITYEYPVEGGDGMGPLLDALQGSIKVK